MRLIPFLAALIACNPESRNDAVCGMQLSEVSADLVAPMTGEPLTRRYTTGAVTTFRVDQQDVPIGVHANAFAGRAIAVDQLGWTDAGWLVFGDDRCPYNNGVHRNASVAMSIDNVDIGADLGLVVAYLPSPALEAREVPLVVSEYMIEAGSVRHAPLLVGAREMLEDLVLATQPPGAILHLDDLPEHSMRSLRLSDHTEDALAFYPPGVTLPMGTALYQRVDHEIEVSGVRTPGVAYLEIEIIPD